MKTNKTEWFKFYHRDFLGDENVLCMDNQEIGIYLRFLSYQWDHRDLPIELEILAGIAQEPYPVFKEIWDKGRLEKCFKKKGKRMSNPRLKMEWDEMEEKAEKKREIGSKGGKAKALNNNSNSSASRVKVEGISTKALQEREVEVEVEVEVEPKRLKHLARKQEFALHRERFESVWEEYPEKKGKEKAWIKFKNQVTTDQAFEDIQKAVVNYKAEVERIRGEGQDDLRFQYGSTWFHENWKDYVGIEKPETWAERRTRERKEKEKTA